MTPSRKRAAGRTVSARTQRMHSAAKSRIMPMMFPETYPPVTRLSALPMSQKSRM